MTTAAVLEREKRSTAGTRMSSLVGQAVEDDDTFWNHSTWEDGKGDGGEESDGSFRESDEDEENRKDAFDSDFNDSESDEDDENGRGKGACEEQDLRREEKMEQGMKRRAAYREPSRGKKTATAMSAGRELMQKKKSAAARKKALKGEGINAGLVLNFPGATPSARSVAKKASVSEPTSKLLQSRLGNRLKARKSIGTPQTIGVKRSLRASTITTSIQANAARRAAAAVSSSTISKVKVQKDYTQEELILEALQITEAENERWILSRKRILDEEQRAELKKKLLGQNASKGKVIRKIQSRRGCYNTITFPDMDYVPEILSRKQQVKNNPTEPLQRKKADVCVITGKVARYRDPKTMMVYHDLAAFKVLRKRFENGEPLDGSIDPETCLPSDHPILSDESRKPVAPTVSIPQLLDNLGCNSAVTIDNPLEGKIRTDVKSNNHLLKNGKTSSPLQLLQLLTEAPTNRLLESGTVSSSHQFIDTMLSKADKREPVSHKDVIVSSLKSSKGGILEKFVLPKSNIVPVTTTYSLHKKNEKLCLHNLKKTSKLEEVASQEPDLKSFNYVAESKVTGGLKEISPKFSRNISQAVKAGQKKCASAESDSKLETIPVNLAARVPVDMNPARPENNVIVASDQIVKTKGATISMSSMNKPSIYKPSSMIEDNYGTLPSDSKISGTMAAVPIVPLLSKSMTATNMKKENCVPGASNSKMKAIATVIPVASICLPKMTENTRLSSNRAFAASCATKSNFIPKGSNVTNILHHKPGTKRTISTKTSTGRKKPKSDVENLLSTPSSVYYGDLQAPLSSHLSPMAPSSFYNPISNFTNPHLRHLIAKSNQIPIGYPHQIQPPPVDMASLYALSLASPLQTVSAPLPLQNQQLHHQRRSLVPMMNYHQPSHMPAASGNIVSDLMRAYNIVSAADSEKRAQQRQQEYDASKSEGNGH